MTALAQQASLPMSYLHTAGPAGDPVTRLGYGLGAVSVAVVLIIAALLLGAILRRRPPRQAGAGAMPEVRREGDGMRWIYIGVALTSVVLVACAIWTLLTLSAVAHPAATPAFTIRVTAQQWWWRVRYEDGQADHIFLTANEIHIPVGRPVRLELESADVIHSFWVPQLAGKTDMIPGLTNVAWFQADRAGVYRGQCGEFCGAQHAHMALAVVAEPPAQFEAWWRRQLQAAAPGAVGSAAAGQRLLQERCAACHTVRGIDAGGLVGPDLTHLMSRARIAGGSLPNDSAHLREWIGHAPDVKPGTTMPGFALSRSDMGDLLAYLTTLH